MRFYGSHEIRTRLGVSRQRVYQLTSKDDFPEPVAVLEQGKVWAAEPVEAWIAKRRERYGLVMRTEEPAS